MYFGNCLPERIARAFRGRGALDVVQMQAHAVHDYSLLSRLSPVAISHLPRTLVIFTYALPSSLTMENRCLLVMPFSASKIATGFPGFCAFDRAVSFMPFLRRLQLFQRMRASEQEAQKTHNLVVGDRFRLVHRIGSGTFGTVLLGKLFRSSWSCKYSPHR